MDEIFEMDWENCPYCDCIYTEWDTGYREYECELWKGGCCGGRIEYGCPLSFKYELKDC